MEAFSDGVFSIAATLLVLDIALRPPGTPLEQVLHAWPAYLGYVINDLFEGRIAEELARLSDVGQIRIVDAVFVVREGDDIAMLSVSDLDDDQRTELRAAVGALVGLGVAGGEGAVAGAETGASIDVSAALQLRASLIGALPDRSSAPRARHPAPVGCPAANDAVRDAGGARLELGGHLVTSMRACMSTEAGATSAR